MCVFSHFIENRYLSVAFFFFFLCGAAKQQRGVDSRGSCSTACQQSGVRVIHKRHVTSTTTSYLQDRDHAPFRLPFCFGVVWKFDSESSGISYTHVREAFFFLFFVFLIIGYFSDLTRKKKEKQIQVSRVKRMSVKRRRILHVFRTDRNGAVTCGCGNILWLIYET